MPGTFAALWVMERGFAGHERGMAEAVRLEAREGVRARRRVSMVVPARLSVTLEEIYDAHFDFVWRNVRRLGVPPAYVDDAVQDVFIVVHRKLAEFEGRSSLRTWLFGIVLRVAHDHRRTARRKGLDGRREDSETVSEPTESGPLERAARSEAAQILHRFLDDLDDDKRVVFMLSELEQMTAPEVAETLGVPLNTVYSRLRAARLAFDETVSRLRARDEWRQR